MMRLAIVFAISAIANAQIGDETSLIQVQKALKRGTGRDASAEKVTPDLLEEGSTEVATETEAFELEDSSWTQGPTPPPGCQDMGCIGKGPHCGGNDFDCTSRGWVTTGYYKRCSLKDTCKSGFKVRCAKCTTPAPPAAPMPTPAAVAAAWTTPPPAPTPAPPLFTPAPPAVPTLPSTLGFRPFDNHGVVPAQDKYVIDFSKAGGWGGYCLCPDGVEYGVGDEYNYCNGMAKSCVGGTLVTKNGKQCNMHSSPISTSYHTGWSGGMVTCANPDAETPLNLLIQALKNATSLVKSLNANATQNKKMEKRAGKGALSARKSAVIFARKVSLSNISIYKATSAMSTAYFAQKAAAEEAQKAMAQMKNANAHMRYYQKIYIDQEQLIKDAAAALKVGKDAYKKAKSDLKIANKAQKVWVKFEKKKMQRQAKGAKRQLKSAQKNSIKWGMEQAYLESSAPDRNLSNVPPYGRGGKKWHVGFGRMGKR